MLSMEGSYIFLYSNNFIVFLYQLLYSWLWYVSLHKNLLKTKKLLMVVVVVIGGEMKNVS